MFPKETKKKKRKIHKKSIIHDQRKKQCLLCMLMDNDFSEKPVHDHHIYSGTANRRISEEEGMKCNLCIEKHHEYGKEAVHQNRFNNVIMKTIGQQIFEEKYSTQRFVALFAKSYKELEDANVNKVILSGRLTKDPEVRYSAGETQLAIARFTLAADRRFKREGEADADFIPCISFGKTAEFAEKYFRKGMKITISGRIQTGSYIGRDNRKVFTTEVVIEEQEFAESRKESKAPEAAETRCGEEGFIKVPDGIEEDLPFS